MARNIGVLLRGNVRVLMRGIFLVREKKECSSGNFAGGYVECDGNRQTCNW